MPVTGEPRIIYGRDAYIPEWSPVYDDLALSVPVKNNGVPMGFTLRDVLPERRWAVQASGELMDQRDFEERYKQYIERTVVDGRLVSIRSKNARFDAGVAPIPRVDRFVNTAHDFMGREIRIGFNPEKAPEKKDIVPIAAAPSSPALRVQIAQLSELKERGILSDEQFSAEVSRLVTEPVAPAPSGPPPGFALAPAGPEEAPVTAATAEVFAARCGKECASKAGQMAHERNCKACNPTEPQEAA